MVAYLFPVFYSVQYCVLTKCDITGMVVCRDGVELVVEYCWL